MRVLRATELEDDKQSDSRTELVADGLLVVSKAADFLGLSRSKIYALMDSGELVYVKLGRARRIPRRALIELAAANLKGGCRSAQ